ncbi:hypothetical protein AB0O47_19170 [Streptomyces noursei]
MRVQRKQCVAGQRLRNFSYRVPSQRTNLLVYLKANSKRPI